MRTLLLAATLFIGLFSAFAQSDRLQPQAFQQMIGKNGAQLIDVRTPEEFAKGHIEGARNIDWLGSDFMAQAAKLDKTKPVLLYCAAGGRSEEALEAMKMAGYSKAMDMSSGFNGWKKAGLPTTTK